MAIVTLAVSSERLGRPVVGGRPRTGYEVVRLAGVAVVHLWPGPVVRGQAQQWHIHIHPAVNTVTTWPDLLICSAQVRCSTGPTLLCDYAFSVYSVRGFVCCVFVLCLCACDGSKSAADTRVRARQISCCARCAAPRRTRPGVVSCPA